MYLYQALIFHYLPAWWGFHFWLVSPGMVYANSPNWAAWFHSPTPMPLNSWCYVGITYDFSSGVAKLWVNGQAVSKVNAGITELTTQYDVRIGAKDGVNDQRYFKGRICCIQVYNKPLSQEEIIAVQNRTFQEASDDHFYPVSVQQQQPGDILHTFPGSTLMECLLRCSRMNESNSIERTITGQSPRGYCHLYRAPFAKTLKYQNQHQDKQYYNKNKLV